MHATTLQVKVPSADESTTKGFSTSITIRNHYQKDSPVHDWQPKGRVQEPTRMIDGRNLQTICRNPRTKRKTMFLLLLRLLTYISAHFLRYSRCSLSRTLSSRWLTVIKSWWIPLRVMSLSLNVRVTSWSFIKSHERLSRNVFRWTTVSCNLNSYNSKNHLIRTCVWVWVCGGGVVWQKAPLPLCVFGFYSGYNLETPYVYSPP